MIKLVGNQLQFTGKHAAKVKDLAEKRGVSIRQQLRDLKYYLVAYARLRLKELGKKKKWQARRD